MMVLSMLTNSLIVGFSSEQLAVWCPWMYETIDNDQYIVNGYGRYLAQNNCINVALIKAFFSKQEPKRHTHFKLLSSGFLLGVGNWLFLLSIHVKVTSYREKKCF